MTTNLTTGEQIVLLALDEKTGDLREAPLRVSLAASAAALLELELPEPRSAAAGLMDEHRRAHPEETPREWLLAVREPALDAAYQGLLEKGIVQEQGRRVLGAFGSVKHPVTDPSELVALRGRLTAVLAEGQEPDERTAVLLAVLRHSGLTAVLPQGFDERLTALTEEQGQAAELGDAIRTTIGALTAVIATAAL
ncbi:GPP34 family phosphoprotein [Streptomyces niveiscabiei]|uniref:GOLPH3/VPS74 family protein n=1 Tax=Streptomyces niveiscabiei TaxID=164115 RepID=UPI0029A3D26E|nr:GPP34 family phosphoprotein [Streptomyces niveiscabiei]MDX3387411.1 GPP34 family phosphoprotein [Streptomyces niveiscabiei]